MRGQEETSTNNVGHKRGGPRESPTTSSLVVVMSVEELRSFNQVPTNISMKLSDDATFSAIEGEDKAIYFTRKQVATGLHLPVPSFVKHFLHFTRSPPAPIHPNIFRILMGCSVLNFLY